MAGRCPGGGRESTKDYSNRLIGRLSRDHASRVFVPSVACRGSRHVGEAEGKLISRKWNGRRRARSRFTVTRRGILSVLGTRISTKVSRLLCLLFFLPLRSSSFQFFTRRDSTMFGRPEFLTVEILNEVQDSYDNLYGSNGNLLVTCRKFRVRYLVTTPTFLRNK